MLHFFKHQPRSFWLLTVCILLLIPSALVSPLGRDQGIFAWVAQTMQHGAAPYTNAWDIKGPLTYYLYGLGLFIAPGRSFGIVLIDLLLLGAVMLTFIQLADKYFAKRDMAYVACLIVLLNGGVDFLHAGQPDGWAAYLVVIVIGLLDNMNGQNARRMACVSGMLIAAAVLLKPHYVLMALPCVVELYLFDRTKRSQSILIAVFGLSGLAVGLLQLSVLYFSHGLPAFMGVIDFFLNCYSRDTHRWTSIRTFLQPRCYIVVAYDLFFLGSFIGIWYLTRKSSKLARLFLLCLDISWLVLLLQGKFLMYQFILPIIVGAFPLACFMDRLRALMESYESADSFSVRLFNTASGFIAYAGIWGALAVSFLGYYNDNVLKVLHRCMTGSHIECMSTFSLEGYNAGEMMSAASFVQAHTQPDDYIYLWGFDAGFYVMANRPSSSRFGYSYPLLIKSPRLRQAHRQELLASFAQHPPQMIGVEKADRNPMTDTEISFEDGAKYGWRNSNETLVLFPELDTYIKDHFVKSFGNDKIDLYTRKP